MKKSNKDMIHVNEKNVKVKLKLREKERVKGFEIFQDGKNLGLLPSNFNKHFSKIVIYIDILNIQKR